MSCEYCTENPKIFPKAIKKFNFQYCDMDIFISESSIEMNTYNHFNETGRVTEDIYGDIPIKYCPMCGRKLRIEE